MLKIHESLTASGSIAAVFVTLDDGKLALVNDDGTTILPDGALDAVMARFGAPLDDGARMTDVASLDLGDGRILRHARHLARFDVIAKDWLICDVDGEARCALATTIAGALDHLARAQRAAAT